MATGSSNMTTYKASQVIGNDSAQNLTGALLQSGASAERDTWIFANTYSGIDGIKHVYNANTNKFKVINNSTDQFWVDIDNGDVYVAGKLGIGYDPNTSGNTYKLYVNGLSYFNNSAYFYDKIGIGYDPETQGNTYKLYVNGSAYFNIGTSDNTSDLKFVINGNSRYLALGGGGMQACTSADAVTTLYLNFNGGQTYVGGSSYLVGNVGIGYDPDTSGNTYKLYVNGDSYFANTITGDIISSWHILAGRPDNMTDFNTYFETTANLHHDNPNRTDSELTYNRWFASNDDQDTYGPSALHLPVVDQHIISLGIDNGATYSRHIAFDIRTNAVYVRARNNNTWTNWEQLVRNTGTWDINISGTATALTSNAGSARQPVYFSGGKPVAANFTVAHFGNAEKTNMNDVGRLHASSGMTNLSSTGNADTPQCGTTYRSGWHLYWSTNYSDDPNGTNAWVAQIINRAGTDEWWVRSRNGGTITNGTAWTSGWRHLVTSAQAGVGGNTIPIYINENGEAAASTTTVGATNRPIYLNAGTMTAVSWYYNSCTINGGNQAHYPWHRFATCTTGAGQWTDKTVIVVLHSRYDGGQYGMVKLSIRTNATNAAKSTSAVWIYRRGFAVDDIKISAPAKTTGTDETINAYIKCGTYPRRIAYILEGSNVGWSLVSSNEPSDTTASDKKGGTEINASVSGNNATDGATVSYANSAGTASALNNGATAGPQIKLPSGQTTFSMLTSGNGAAYVNYGKLGLADSYSNIDISTYRFDCYGGHARIHTGCLHIFPASMSGQSYNEGLRIHCSSGSWATIMLCGTDNTGNSGTSTNSWGIFNNNGTLYINKATSSGAGNPRVYANANGWYFTKAYGAVWNDYAEYRQAEINEPGRVIIPSQNGIAKLSTERLQSGGRIISDTYGFAVGESDRAKTPVGLSGRVLAYPFRIKEDYKIGDAVCTAPNGTIDIMSRDEIMKYPERILGIVNEIPDYEIWQETLECPGGEPSITKIEVKGRIWIDIK